MSLGESDGLSFDEDRETMHLVRRILVASLLAVASLVPSVEAKADELSDGAHALIESIADSAIVELTDPAISREKRKERMRELMHRYFNVPGIAQWVLGRHWRKATDAEREEYLKIYEDLMIETYVDRFTGYNGETVEVLSVDVRNGKDAIVATSIRRPENVEPLKVDWRVREFDGVYRVIDIMVEGVSMGQAQRSEFSSVISNNGGDLSEFLKTLRQRVETASAAGTG